MGSRGWMIPVENADDVDVLRKWLANANRDGGAVSFVGLCKRTNGSVWALVNSDGSGCIDTLLRYGYSSDQRIKLLGDYPEWDRRGSPLGPLSKATYSPYLDARPDEFVSDTDWRSGSHWPPSYVIPLDSEDQREDLMSVLVQSARMLPCDVSPGTTASATSSKETERCSSERRYATSITRLLRGYSTNTRS